MTTDRTIRPAATMDDRGVSEVLSFVLVFGILLSSVVLVGLFGFGAIQDYQRVEKVGNAERAMDAFAAGANDVVRYDGVDRRSGELALRGGTARPGTAGTELSVSVYEPGASDPTWNTTDNYSDTLGAFVYETGGETVAYEGGGVFRGTADGESVVRSEPSITNRTSGGENTAFVSLVFVTESDRSIRSQDGFVFDVQENRSTRTLFDGIEEVVVDVGDGPYADAWNRYFEEDDDWHPDGDRWVLEADRVSVDVVEVGIEYPERD